jgi:hypothetical protein
VRSFAGEGIENQSDRMAKFKGKNNREVEIMYHKSPFPPRSRKLFLLFTGSFSARPITVPLVEA